MEGDEEKSEKPNLKGDVLNIALLSFLYVLQAIPYGLSLALPLILQNRNASYTDQAEFSFVSYSFCFKLLWAPIVDCVYSKRIGRRKTWLVPTQYLIGLILLLISMNVDEWLGSEDGTRKPNVRLLAISFFLCIFFASTQDIAVDGWSLTMLKKRNVGHSSTCYNIGYAVGQFLAFVLFIILDSKDFCNMFRTVPQDKGFISFADFIFFWSMVFMVSTTLILVFKKDDSLRILKDGDECRLGLKESYQHLWKICKIGPIQTICFLLLTCQVIFGPVQGVAALKLIDAGVPREQYVLLTIPSLPFQFVLPFLLGNQLTGSKSMRSFLVSYILKLIHGGLFTAFIFFIPYVKDGAKVLPAWYYWLLLFMYNLDNLTMYVMWIAALAFFSRVSDPRFGGMYLTLLNTVTNIGYYWPVSTCLWLLDVLTVTSCVEDKAREYANEPSSMFRKFRTTEYAGLDPYYADDFHDSLTESGSEKLLKCWTVLDGFYIEVIVCTVLGALWLYFGRKYIYKLEKTDISAWTVKMKQNDEKEKQSLAISTDSHP